jgi:hypothetical protein
VVVGGEGVGRGGGDGEAVGVLWHGSMLAEAVQHGGEEVDGAALGP